MHAEDKDDFYDRTDFPRHSGLLGHEGNVCFYNRCLQLVKGFWRETTLRADRDVRICWSRGTDVLQLKHMRNSYFADSLRLMISLISIINVHNEVLKRGKRTKMCGALVN